MSAPRIYLDHAATTPLSTAAREAMADALGRWANPSSPHAEGRAARAALEGARSRIKAALGWTHDLIFTSGTTESAQIALTRQSRERPCIVSAVEHASVLRQRADAIVAPVGADGLVEPLAFGALMHAHPQALVAIQHGNSETGILQRIDEIVEVVDAAGGVLFVDCAQTAGKLPLPPADLIAVSAHKLGGPPGIGALLVRDMGILAPLGGGQERGYRAGTENLPAILGFAAALDPALAGAQPPWLLEQIEWRLALETTIARSGGLPVGGDLLGGTARTPTIAAYRLPGMSAEAQLIRLDAAGFAVSAGSACSSGSLHTSHVLGAMGLTEAEAREVIRVSFGWSTTRAEVEAFAAAYAQMAGGRRSA
ncbi:aminotransferase class V-fold PLP-dependent enzyme [Sphingomonas sp. AP4-R1]|uniref:cysteine desulfurase family protein n=1 Tax=Sphingomonas sp. AP4-R1 TaxID=2735134 RepID=UPI00149384B1|nr:aminotransferase class V-fold PLP-dependent enzyme [Sphingomonas sp. AP4-R1]QJU60382.1 aminotransferase class V-fold PLP-dependent enzyme [Sphingomonas sp. AP4-R1]